MIQIYTDIKSIDSNQWDNLVTKSEVTTFFQTKSCYNFYESLSFLKPFIFAVSEENKLMAVMCGYIVADGSVLKKYFSRRAIVPGGILLDPNISDEALYSLLTTANKILSSKVIYIELRNYSDYSLHKSIFENCDYKYHKHLNFHVSTPDYETSFKQLSSTKRRDIKISKKENAIWYESDSITDLKIFFNILNELYKTKIKTPLFPFEFFEKLTQQPFGKFFVVKYKDEVVGGSICTILEDNTVFEWFVCGIDGKYKNIYPSTLATWAAIEYASLNKFRKFDMMGAGKPNEGYGVRDFKAKFGGELVEHGRFLNIFKPVLFTIGKYFIQVLKSKK